MLLRTSVSLFALSIPGSIALAQSVHVVDDNPGPGVDFTTIAAAVAAAQDGDAILVRDGSYGDLTSGEIRIDGKGLVLSADGVNVSFQGRIAIQNLTSSQAVVVNGLTVEPPAGGTFGALEVVDCDGTVHVQDVTFDAFVGHIIPHMVLVSGSSSVQFTRVSVSGGTNPFTANEGVHAIASSLHLYDCEILGGNGYGGLGGPFEGGEGVRLEDGYLYALSSTIQGGQGTGIGSPFGCTGVSGAGGTGLFMTGVTSHADLLDSAPLGGLPGDLFGTGTCTQGAVGAPMVIEQGTLSNIAFPERHFTVSTPVRSDEPVQVTVDGQPGDLVWLTFSAATSAASFANVFGPLWVESPVLIAVGPLPGGDLSFATTTFVPPGAEFLTYYAQALFVDPVLGAVLSDPAHILELDAAF